MNANVKARWTTAGPAGGLAEIKARIDGKRVTATVTAP
jgi:hypothetical protein